MNFTVQVREATGKGSNRKLRAKGNAPGVIYGQGEPQLISVRADRAKRFIQALGGKCKLIDLTIETAGEPVTKKVILQDYQANNLGTEVIHVDFLEVTDDTMVTLNVPIETTQNCEAIKLGGVLQVIRRTIPVRCAAKHLPESFLINIDSMKVGESFHVRSIDYPEGVTPIVKDRDFTVLTLTGRKKAR